MCAYTPLSIFCSLSLSDDNLNPYIVSEQLFVNHSQTLLKPNRPKNVCNLFQMFGAYLCSDGMCERVKTGQVSDLCF